MANKFKWFKMLLFGCENEESDFGRKFGWEVIYRECKVAELKYIERDDVTQFWYSYEIEWENESFGFDFPMDAWSENGVVLRNKVRRQVEIKNYLSSGCSVNDVVYLRNVSA